jgi:hypothetical protein
MREDDKQSGDSSGGDARSLPPADETAGGADSSPLENVPSGEKQEATQQNMIPGRLQPPGRS